MSQRQRRLLPFADGASMLFVELTVEPALDALLDCLPDRISKQESQTRTSFSMPNFGIAFTFEEHLAQND